MNSALVALTTTDPAWGDGVLFIGLIPVVLIVIAGLQQMALGLAARREDRSWTRQEHDERHVLTRPGCTECQQRVSS